MQALLNEQAMKVAAPNHDTNWAQVDNGSGHGTMDKPEPIMTKSEFITVSAGIGGGVGASVAIEAGVISTANLTALAGLGAAAGAGLGAAGVAGYALGKLINSSDWFQNMVSSVTDKIVHGDPFDHVKVPNIQANGPWEMQLDMTAPGDNMLWFSCDGTQTSAILYDTPLDLTNAHGGITFDSNIYCLWTVP